MPKEKRFQRTFRRLLKNTKEVFDFQVKYQNMNEFEILVTTRKYSS
jgi:hypothetical protein